MVREVRLVFRGGGNVGTISATASIAAPASWRITTSSGASMTPGAVSAIADDGGSGRVESLMAVGDDKDRRGAIGGGVDGVFVGVDVGVALGEAPSGDADREVRGDFCDGDFFEFGVVFAEEEGGVEGGGRRVDLRKVAWVGRVHALTPSVSAWRRCHLPLRGGIGRRGSSDPAVRSCGHSASPCRGRSRSRSRRRRWSPWRG